MRTRGFTVAAMLAVACGSDRKSSSNVPAANHQATAASQTTAGGQVVVARGRAVPPTEEGAWQVFDLPAHWVARYVGQTGVAGAYVALAAAHPEDIRERGSCAASPRIVVGLVHANGNVREHTALCLHYCGAPESADRPYRGLFGTHTHLQGITLQILDNGALDVIEHYRELAFVPPEILEDPQVVDKLRYKPDVQIRHDTLRGSDFKFTGNIAQSCAAIEP